MTEYSQDRDRTEVGQGEEKGGRPTKRGVGEG